MKRLRAGLRASMAIGLLAAMIPTSGALAWTGSGTLSDPYWVNDCTELQAVGTNLSAHYLVTQDIDCSGVTFTPIGNSSTPFTGHFDGDGFTVSDLTINLPTTDYIGLFGAADGATIKDINLYGANITGQVRVGAIVGHALNTTDISHVTINATTVIGQQYVGGLVGALNDSMLNYGQAAVDQVSGSRAGLSTAVKIGGAVGLTDNSTVNKSFVTGTVTGNNLGSASDSVGGFVGEMNMGSTINDSYTTASVTAHAKSGGFVGSAVSSSTNRSWASGAVEGTTDVGGFVGYEGLGMHTDSFAMGSVTGVTNVGGFFGHVLAVGGDANNSYFDVTRTGLTDCVGLDEGISYSTTCTGVNAASSAPNYFHNNATNEPLDGWNFTSVWRTTTTTPTLVWVPERPDNVRVVPSPTSLTFSWEVPANTGGSAITSYDIRYKPSSSKGSYNSFTGLSAATLSQVLNNLIPSTEYTIYLRANNAIGHGTWTGIITYTSAASTTVTTAPKVNTAAATVPTDEPAAVPADETASAPPPVTENSDDANSNDESAGTGSSALSKVVWGAVSAVGLGIAYIASLQSKKIAK
ncbi:MAG: fibronectin type III domain-containing protein [Candidatus Saccharibacteria bacterium]|nr:fibronectin type III domain-containing protein [Candidatus Saccharibacteria bacterium]